MTGLPRVFDPSAAITIRGARVHNLQGIDLDLPRDRLVVFTGVSGSGKSSLAFDTIFAEGQRRYIECLSSYARQFLDQLQRPDVDLIEGLPPTVAIDQKAGQASPRSTVGTITEIHDYLESGKAGSGKAGQVRYWQCGQAEKSPDLAISDLSRFLCPKRGGQAAGISS